MNDRKGGNKNVRNDGENLQGLNEQAVCSL